MKVACRWNCKDKRVGLSLVGLVPAILLILVSFILFGHSFRYVEVSNVEMKYNLSYDPQHSNIDPALNVTIKNTHSSELINEGVTVDGTSYGTTYFLVPQDQTRNMTFPLRSLNLASSKTYEVQLTFNFTDGKQQSYSESYTTPQFKGQAQVNNSSLTVPQSNDNSSSTIDDFFRVEGVSVFLLTIQNTGNLPITKIDCTVDNQNQSLVVIGLPVMPKDTVTGWEWLWLGTGSVEPQTGTVYSVTIKLTYVDGNTSTIQTSSNCTILSPSQGIKAKKGMCVKQD